MTALARPELEEVRASWLSHWEDALAAWSRFTKLTPPRFCLCAEEEKREGLSGSFAMIRLLDHAVVVSLKQVQDLGLEAFSVEVLAHEVGHHVYAPADLRDNARLLARVRRGLPTVEAAAPLVANLYTDLLINDRLQRHPLTFSPRRLEPFFAKLRSKSGNQPLVIRPINRIHHCLGARTQCRSRTKDKIGRTLYVAIGKVLAAVLSRGIKGILMTQDAAIVKHATISLHMQGYGLTDRAG